MRKIILCGLLGWHRWEFQYRNPNGGRHWWRFDACRCCRLVRMSDERIDAGY